jgi:hypothetical protein
VLNKAKCWVSFLKRHVLPCGNAKSEQVGEPAQRSGSPTYTFFIFLPKPAHY